MADMLGLHKICPKALMEIMVQTEHEALSRKTSTPLIQLTIPLHDIKKLSRPKGDRREQKGDRVGEAPAWKHYEALKSLAGEPTLMLGAESFWERLERLKLKALVGLTVPPFEDEWWTNETLGGDLVVQWFQVLKYRPKFSFLSHCWICFHFLNTEDSELILASPWVNVEGF